VWLVEPTVGSHSVAAAKPPANSERKMMSIFSSILEKLGLQKPAAPAPAPAAKPVVGAEPSARPAGPGGVSAPSARPAGPGGMSAPATLAGIPGASAAASGMAAPQAAPMAMVDVVGKLDTLAKGSPGMDWKVSIVDMLKVLGMDSGLAARKELATELGCPSDLMGGDYAKMNVWLHEAVLKKIAENGGNIPAALLKK
jgi:hypothetical protein